jgi:hypothetical protein
MPQYRDCARYRTVSTFGECIEVLLQDPALPRPDETGTMLPLIQEGAMQASALHTSPGTTLYQRCRVYEIVGPRIAPPPLRRRSDGVDGSLRGSPAQMFIYLFVYL